MNESLHRTVSPQQFIRTLFAATENGKLAITYYPLMEPPCTITYDVDWNAADAEALVQQYEALETMLRKFGSLHDALEDPAQRKTLLTPDERSIWETYLLPFEPFDVDDATMSELFQRDYCGDQLTDEEYELVERHYEWFKANCLQRLPCVRCSPDHLFRRVNRYECLVRYNAPESIVNEEGCYLAEELIHYYYGQQQEQE